MPDLAAQALLPVNTALAVVLLVLLLAAAATAAVCRLSPDGSRGRAREILVAGARATAQLAVVSLAIGWVVHHTAALFAFLLLMFAVATRTAGRRITPNGTWWWAALPIAGPVVPVVTGLTLAGLLPVRGIAMIPVTGILIGGALTVTVLAGAAPWTNCAPATASSRRASPSASPTATPAWSWPARLPRTPCCRASTRPARSVSSPSPAPSSACSWAARPRCSRAPCSSSC